MRIGVNLPATDARGQLLDGSGLEQFAAMCEDVGLDGLWRGDHLPIPGSDVRTRPDPLMSLLVAARATSQIELGTCIYAPGLRGLFEVAQRFATMVSLAPGRFTIGVGTGSQKSEYDAAGVDWDGRFARLREYMEQIWVLLDGEPATATSGGDAISPVERAQARATSRPRFVLGAWFSEPQLRRAAELYDGWMASGGGFNQRLLRGERPVQPDPDAAGTSRFGDWKSLRESVRRYRDMGGTRPMMSTIPLDLEMESTPMTDEGMFNLQCSPTEASDRLHFLEEIGFDDVIIVPGRQLRTDEMEQHRYGYTRESLEQIRSLMPRDPRRIV